VLSTSVLLAPWGFDKGVVSRAAPFHVIVEGRCLLEVPGRPAVELAVGDLVIFPRGHPHSLYSDPGVSRVPFAAVLEANGMRGTWSPGQRIERLDHIRYGGQGALTRMINGLFVYRDHRSNPLVESLPAVLHVRGRMGRGQDWFQSSQAFLIDEASSERPGFQTLIERLADIMFVHAIRDHMTKAPGDAGWLRGLADPQVARAISLIHSQPEHPWTVASLGKAVALSRTVFARRFRQMLGSSVMEYVAMRRMHVAAGLLAESTHAMSTIANGVGYESEISFNKAFKRWAGMPPGQYRREVRSSASVAVDYGQTARRAAPLMPV
jgi:AraC-like DNA-binding protein